MSVPVAQLFLLARLALLIPLGALATPPEKKRVDCWGDPLPEGAVARIGSVRLRHGDSIGALAFSPDGKLLASASWDRTVSVWDSATGQERHRLHAGDVRALGFSGDGKRL